MKHGTGRMFIVVPPTETLGRRVEKRRMRDAASEEQN